jgi:hypothetical protein
VYATVSTKEKAGFLNEIRILSSHIFSSRDISDLTKAVVKLPKGGFDVILSTSKGEMLYTSLKALAPLGHLIDVGRMDVQDSKMIGLELFQKSATFLSFDLIVVLDSDPSIGMKLIHAVDNHYRAGSISPIRPYTPTEISHLDQVLLGFSKGTHIGKLVVTFQNPSSLLKMIPARPAARFDPESCYVITGALSGLGRSMISWMTGRSAQYFVVLSRRGIDSPEAQTLVKTLEKRGAAIQIFTCDVSNKEQVVDAINQASLHRRVKGIVHSAVSYQDLSFNDLTIEQWREGLAAKVLGSKTPIQICTSVNNLQLSFPLMLAIISVSLTVRFSSRPAP